MKKKCIGIPIRRIIVSIVLGTITTVAVAWFFAAFVRPQSVASGTSGESRMSGGQCIEWWRSSLPGSSIVVLSFHVFLPDVMIFNEPIERPSWVIQLLDTPGTFSTDCRYALRSAGWPVESMWCNHKFDERHNTNMLFGGVSIPMNEPGITPVIDRALPLYIFPSGFAIDTALYAALWFALLTGLLFTRRKWRIRKGRCPACGYDLRGSPQDATCPECGTTVATAVH